MHSPQTQTKYGDGRGAGIGKGSGWGTYLIVLTIKNKVKWKSKIKVQNWSTENYEATKLVNQSAIQAADLPPDPTQACQVIWFPLLFLCSPQRVTTVLNSATGPKAVDERYYIPSLLDVFLLSMGISYDLFLVFTQWSGPNFIPEWSKPWCSGLSSLQYSPCTFALTWNNWQSLGLNSCSLLPPLLWHHTISSWSSGSVYTTLVQLISLSISGVGGLNCRPVSPISLKSLMYFLMISFFHWVLKILILSQRSLRWEAFFNFILGVTVKNTTTYVCLYLWVVYGLWDK